MKKILICLVIALAMILTVGVAGCSYTVILDGYTPSSASASATADPNTFAFSANSVTIYVGQTYNLADKLETNISGTTLDWSIIGGAGLITISDSSVTGAGAGTANVKVSTNYQGTTYSDSINVVVQDTTISVTDGDPVNPTVINELTLYVGDVLDLSSYISSNIPLNNISAEITNGSGSTYVSLGGKTITAQQASGNDYAEITLTASSPYSASSILKVYVKAAPSFAFNNDNIYLYVGGHITLLDTITTNITSPTISYEFLSGSDYASIADGVITGATVGVAELRASLALPDSFLKNVLTDTATVTVVSAGTFSLSVDNVSMLVGGTKDMWDNVTQNLYTPVTASECTWSITAGTSATVNASGVVSGNSVGTSVLTVSLSQYGLTFTDSANVAVANPYLNFSTSNLTITVADIVDLDNYVQTNLTGVTYTWTQIDGPAYATLDTYNAEITGVSLGVAHVSVSAPSGGETLTANLTVTVVAPQIGMKNENGDPTDTLYIFEDESIALYNFMDTNILGPTGYVWSITNGAAFADIESSTGQLSAAAVGTVTVKVTTARTLGSASCTFTVQIAALPTIAYSSESIGTYVGDVIPLKDLVTLTNTALTKDDIVWSTESTFVTLSTSGQLTINSLATVSPQIKAAITTSNSLGNRTFDDTLITTISLAPTLEFTPTAITINVDDVEDLSDNIVTSLTSPTYVWQMTEGADTIITMAGGDGIITGILGGQAKVQVSVVLTYQTISAEVNITVLPVNPTIFGTERVIIYKNNLQHTRVQFTGLNDTIFSIVQQESYKPDPAGGTSSITVPSYSLVANTDYTYSVGSATCTLTLLIDYLDTLDITGEYEIIVEDSLGARVNIQLLVVENVITTAAELQAIGSTRETLLGSYILGNDIDCSSIPYFEPLGEYYNDNYWATGGTYENIVFMGVLDGAGHTIYNVNIDSLHCTQNIHRSDWSQSGIEGGRNIGLFSYIGQNAIVRNVTFSNFSVTTTNQIAGVVAGTVQGIIENCKVDCLTYKTSGGTFAAATIGAAYSSGNSSCAVNSGGWEGGGSYGLDCFTGVFAGVLGEQGTIKHCISLGTINAVSTKSIRAFVGKSYGTITSCFAYAISPFNGTTFKNFATNVTYLDPANNTDDATTFNGIRDSVPVGIVLVDLNHLLGGFAYLNYYGYWNSTTKVLVPQKYGDPSTTYTNEYYLFVNNSGMKTTTELVSSSTYIGFTGAQEYYNYDTDIWTIDGSTIPTLKITYTAS